MSYSCSVCNDYLNRSPQNPGNKCEINISCTPCGHIFHTICLDAWMSCDLPTSKHCPFCHEEIHTKIPLFPTIREENSQMHDANNNLHIGHDQELMEVTKKIQLLQLKQKYVTQLENVLTNEQEVQMNTAQHQLNELKKSVELCARFKAYWKQLKQSWDTTDCETDLENLQSIQNVIESLEMHVRDMGDYPVTTDSIETLKNVNAVLTQELRDSIAQTKAAQEEQVHLLHSNSKARATIKILNDMTSNLEKKVSAFKTELEEFQKLNEGLLCQQNKSDMT